MKQTRRIPALLLAMLMLFSLTLTSCGKEEPPVPADQVAVALFNTILKDDASSLVELFGYADEDEARKDMGLEGSLYEGLADEVVSQFKAMQLDVTAEDAQTFLDAFMTMFKNVNMTAKVKESDEKAGTAVVTCTINTFDPEAMTNAMTGVLNEVISDPALMEDEAALTSALLNGMSSAIAGITPGDSTADFDVDFELADMDVNGKTKKVWVPEDAAEFGNLVSTTALGG